MRRTSLGLAILVAAATTVIGASQGPGPDQRGATGRQTPTRAAAVPGDVKGSAIFRGFVVAADTGQPLRRAQVRITSPEARESRLATTDSQGRFEARDLPAGRYTLTASKGGFVSLQYGQRRPSQQGTPIVITDGQVVERLVIALPRGSIISGRITDEFGEPVANAVVSAVRFGYAGGSRRPLPAGGQNARDTTDDLGQFRLFGLSPGEYYVTAAFRMGGNDVTDPGEDITGFAPTYYPGVSSLGEAQRVAVGLGQETMNTSFALVATKLVRITGAVMDSNGAPVNGGGMVMLAPADTRAVPPMMQGGSGRIDGTGRFRITNVAPGRYTLQARIARQSNEFARLPITVGAEDVENVALVTSLGATASGRVIGDAGQAPALTPGDVSVNARRASLNGVEMVGNNVMFGESRGGRVDASWTFEIAGLLDSYVFRANTPQGWALDAVTLNGQDITDTAIELSPGQKLTGLTVVLTNRLTDLSGTITDERGQPVLDASVLVFPADDRLWTAQSRFIRVVRPDQSGRFQVRGLPAHNDYLVLPVQALEDGQGNDPEFLATVRGSATSLRLAKGESKVLDLRMK